VKALDAEFRASGMMLRAINWSMYSERLSHNLSRVYSDMTSKLKDNGKLPSFDWISLAKLVSSYLFQARRIELSLIFTLSSASKV
jgi:hypothetical protein